jgi:quercetin dioxygenase-like cupin family protein
LVERGSNKLKITRIEPAFEDERGKISDIITGKEIQHVNLITFKKGAIRANHYHKESFHFNYVLKGSLKIVTEDFKGVTESAVVGTGDLIEIPQMVKHALTALDDTDLLVFTRGPRGGENYEKDTYRLNENELLLR